jgi:6,7-dimethyl-8-ribityllumazine synthase
MSANLPSRPRQAGLRRNFAIVAGQYNAEYVRGLIEHARAELFAISPNFSIQVYEVPGAFEIPLLVQEIATRGQVDAIIALGVIIAGETQHAALIGAEVTRSLQQLALTHRLPVVHEVLLLQSEAQAKARCLDEEINRGTEAARVAARMVQVLSDLRNSRSDMTGQRSEVRFTPR